MTGQITSRLSSDCKHVDKRYLHIQVTMTPLCESSNFILKTRNSFIFSIVCYILSFSFLTFHLRELGDVNLAIKRTACTQLQNLWDEFTSFSLQFDLSSEKGFVTWVLSAGNLFRTDACGYREFFESEVNWLNVQTRSDQFCIWERQGRPDLDLIWLGLDRTRLEAKTCRSIIREGLAIGGGRSGC